MKPERKYIDSRGLLVPESTIGKASKPSSPPMTDFELEALVSTLRFASVPASQLTLRRALTSPRTFAEARIGVRVSYRRLYVAAKIFAKSLRRAGRLLLR